MHCWQQYSLSFPSLIRSSHTKMCKKGVLKNFAKFTGKNLSQSLFFNKVAGLRQNFKEHLFHRTPPVAASVLWQPSALGDNLLMLRHFLQPSEKSSSLFQFGQEVNILRHSIERRAYSLILKIATMFSFPRVGIGWWILL